MEYSVEGLASSIVREFLNKKKCVKTLQLLDTEWPRSESSVSSRSKLAQALKIEPWVDKNKSSLSPLKTMLEVILYNVLQLNVAQISPSDDSILRKVRYGTSNKHFKPKQAPKFSRPLTAGASNVRKVVEKEFARKENAYSTVGALEDVDFDELLDNGTKTPKHPAKINDWSFSPKEKQVGVDETSQKPSLGYQDVDFRSTVAVKKPINQKLPDKDALMHLLEENSEKSIESNQYSSYGKQKNNLFDFTVKKSTNQKSPIEDFLSDISDDTPEKGMADSYQKTAKKFIDSNSQQRYFFANQMSSKATPNVDVLLSDGDCSNSVDFTYELAKELRNLIFGSIKCAFLTEWCDQNFSFSCSFTRPDKLRFGIVQKRGGPCGILAAVQAIVLKYLLFSTDDVVPNESFLNVRDSQRTSCLVQAVTEIIWRAGAFKRATLAIMAVRKQINSLPHEYRCDGITEYVVTSHFNTKIELESAVKQHINSYENGKGSCILLLYSAILSRGIDNVKKDMDEPSGKLMGAHNYCTQEMINLMLVGRATSNAFNNSLQLDEMTLLKGIHTQSEVGLLSLFEHYGSCKIGDYYKTPKYPIWLVCSESHFTVLFGLNPNLTSKFNFPSTITLYYYDGLANQDEVIRLTVDTTAEVEDSDVNFALVPPLEHCIRTKWSRAYIDWNDTEPLL